MKKLLFFGCWMMGTLLFSIDLGVDVFFKEKKYKYIKEKKIGLIMNHTSLDKNCFPSLEKFLQHAKDYSIQALFFPEHGMNGHCYAGEKIQDVQYKNIPTFSLHGKTRRPTKKMLQNIDVLIYDIQDLGSRSYTYITTLFYIMEEAAKNKIKVMVLDRPNPINGIIVDGPMLEEKYRSFVGYINVPYCHGMTVGELALFFNQEYNIRCDLQVIPMKGWKRWMSFQDTKLHWFPTSPNIPEADTPFYYPSTGILGELKILNIGVGYTLPFKIVGAPWLDAKLFAKKLNEQKLPGVLFLPFYFRPFYGLYQGQDCQGVKIIITDPRKYQPVSVQYLILGMIKSLYPKIFLEKLEHSKASKDLFCKVNGTKKIYDILKNEPFPAWKLMKFQKKQREEFLKLREKYLLLQYSKD